MDFRPTHRTKPKRIEVQAEKISLLDPGRIMTFPNGLRIFAPPGTWLVRDANGSYLPPLTDQQFAETFEPIDAGNHPLPLASILVGSGSGVETLGPGDPTVFCKHRSLAKSCEVCKAERERDECSRALHRLALNAGVADLGPDENVTAAVERLRAALRRAEEALAEVAAMKYAGQVDFDGGEFVPSLSAAAMLRVVEAADRYMLIREGGDDLLESASALSELRAAVRAWREMVKVAPMKTPGIETE